MELVVVVLFSGFVWLAYHFLFRNADLAGAMGALYTGLRSEGWPVGVQEEDRDRRWGRPAKPVAADPPEPRPNLARVKPVVHVR